MVGDCILKDHPMPPKLVHDRVIDFDQSKDQITISTQVDWIAFYQKNIQFYDHS